MAAARAIDVPMLLVRGRMSDLVTEDTARRFLADVPPELREEWNLRPPVRKRGPQEGNRGRILVRVHEGFQVPAVPRRRLHLQNLPGFLRPGRQTKQQQYVFTHRWRLY